MNKEKIISIIPYLKAGDKGNNVEGGRSNLTAARLVFPTTEGVITLEDRIAKNNWCKSNPQPEIICICPVNLCTHVSKKIA